MKISRNYPLQHLTTFGVKAKAQFYTELSSVPEVKEFFKEKAASYTNTFVLGGGSNVLFTSDFKGIVLKINIKGKEVKKEDEKYYYVKTGSGENWHEFVLHCIDKGYAGIENLSLIPGNVGASPIQNIGAYGVEVKDVIKEVETVDRSTGEVRIFNNEECKFGYRNSIFKSSHKNKYIITHVTFRLSKQPEFNTSYGAIDQELGKMGVENLSIKAISKAVCNIRSRKLPDPEELGNAGSFFKNPVVSKKKYEKFIAENPSAPVYKLNDSEYKIAAGWLIEQCGWKGKRLNDHGVHENQALVLVNYGEAEGKEILKLSEDILQSVKSKFDIDLEREVNIV